MVLSRDFFHVQTVVFEGYGVRAIVPAFCLLVIYAWQHAERVNTGIREHQAAACTS